MAQSPAPAVARADMDAHLFGKTPRGTREAPPAGGAQPGRERALAALSERTREVMEGALAARRFPAVASPARLGVVGAPRSDVAALTAAAREGPLLPAQRMDVGLPRCGVAEVGELRRKRHG